MECPECFGLWGGCETCGDRDLEACPDHKADLNEDGECPICSLEEQRAEELDRLEYWLGGFGIGFAIVTASAHAVIAIAAVGVVVS